MWAGECGGWRADVLELEGIGGEVVELVGVVAVGGVVEAVPHGGG